MQTKSILLALLVSLGTLTSNAQLTRDNVEKGITQVEQMIEAHKWREAFEHLRGIESGAAGNPSLLYLTNKQRYRMYYRISKPREAADCLQRMEAYALSSRDQKTIEDMLHVKAGYLASKGDAAGSRACYVQMFNRRSTGKDDAGKEACFKQMIDEASKLNNNTMKSVATDLYTAWQDSIASVRAVEELRTLKQNYQAAQEDIDSKDTKISMQWGTIIFLAVVLAGVSLAAVALLLIMLRNARTIKGLRQSLEVSNQNSARKSVFMRNIGNQISPSLQQIAQGNSASTHVAALQRMLADVETFVSLSDADTQQAEVADTDVADLCNHVVSACSSLRVPVTSDATRFSFPVNRESVESLLVKVIGEAAKSSDTQQITVSFKKRNQHMGQFIVTALGMRLDDEQKQSLFTAFAKVYDLTHTTGLVLPICSLIAHNLGGALTLDEQFAKGTRFVLEVHC